MGPASAVIHGGSLAVGKRAYPDAREPWIDLSTGINPVPYPVGDFPPHAFTRLPEPDDLAALEKAAAAAYGTHSPSSVVAAPGTQCLINLIPRLFQNRHVRIVGPTYAEHGRAWAAAGSQVAPVATIDDVGNAAAVILCNPNNPDGRTVRPDRLRDLAAKLAGRGGLLLVDEAFADLEDGISMAPDVPSPGLVVLRSFGKTYGLAGIRLGFALAPPAACAAIREALGPWPVSGAAIAVGRRALADAAWRDTARRRLDVSCERLDGLLAKAGLIHVGGTRLFRLALGDARFWFDRLGKAGILARRFADHPEWLRFGLPGHETEWQRLEHALLRQD